MGDRSVIANRDISGVVITGDIYARDPKKVSYAIIEVEQDRLEECLLKIATMLNVQLSQAGSPIPFIPFDGFERLNRKKLFLYGISGVGKSRAIYELVKARISTFKKIFMLNPRIIFQEKSDEDELYKITNQASVNDALVWDNFPNDLIRRRFSDATEALEIIRSSRASSFVALKPTYLELYRNVSADIPEFHAQGVRYGEQKIRDIIRRYGNEIHEFNEFYIRYVEHYLNEITQILYFKDPTPITIRAFYNELKNRESEAIQDRSNAIEIAKQFLPGSSYYSDLFSIILASKDRQSELDFLYTLNMIYELRLKRTKDISILQKEIFHTDSPSEPLESLNSWIYLSNSFYAIHDLPREAIYFNDDIKNKIINYLRRDAHIISDENEAYYAGIFFGRNIKFIAIDDIAHDNIISAKDLKKRNNKERFDSGLGSGIAENFVSLDEQIQKTVLKIAETNEDLGYTLGEEIGSNFSNLDVNLQNKILESAKDKNKNKNGDIYSQRFTKNLGNGIGYDFKNLGNDLQTEILRIAKDEYDISYNLAMSIGENFSPLDIDLQKDILRRVEEDYDSEFADGIGSGLGTAFYSLELHLKEELLRLTTGKGATQFASSFVMGLGDNFALLDKDSQKMIFNKVEEKAWQHNGRLGFTLGNYFHTFDYELQEQIIRLTKVNRSFAKGFRDIIPELRKLQKTYKVD